MPWIVFTDEPNDFVDLAVHVVAHAPTGPMAVDYLGWIGPTGESRGAAAYHDKRFVLRRVLRDYETAIFLDADSRITALPPLGSFPAGLSVLPVVRKTVSEHLESCGSWRMPAFRELAEHLTGDTAVLRSALWCHESCISVTRDGSESDFFDAWNQAAEFLQARDVFSGEGGVIGLAAACAGWTVDYEAVAGIGSSVRHEGGGPKSN